MTEPTKTVVSLAGAEPVVAEVPMTEDEVAGLASPPTVDDFSRAIDVHLDAIARERGYSSAVSCASYVSSTNALWRAEAEAFVAGRDAVWTYAFAELASVQSGSRAVPSVAEFIAELPAIEWPEAA